MTVKEAQSRGICIKCRRMVSFEAPQYVALALMPGLFGKEPGIIGNMNQNGGGNMKKLSRVATIAVAAAGCIMTCAGISNAEDSISGSPDNCKDRP